MMSKAFLPCLAAGAAPASAAFLSHAVDLVLREIVFFVKVGEFVCGPEGYWMITVVLQSLRIVAGALQRNELASTWPRCELCVLVG